MFLATDESKRTAWYMALEEGHIELLHKLWAWANEVLTPEELKTFPYPKINVRGLLCYRLKMSLKLGY